MADMIDVATTPLELGADPQEIAEANKDNEWQELAGFMAKKYKAEKKKKKSVGSSTKRQRISAHQYNAIRRF